MEDEKKKILGIEPEEYFTGEDWIRAGRRRYMLLNIIYYLQHFAGKEDGVSISEISEFLEVLQTVDREIYSSIVKPGIAVESTLSELLNKGLIIDRSEGKFSINVEKVKSEKDLIYWGSVKRVFDKVNEIMSFGGYRNE
ncbi:hypothetical protein Ferp_0863 [Ferroglobus placidus DSM 10642]|uniref:Uncharacterized protein n=1 Tax=Ferroglobus placidus (strain DSM 10642 / AEDII12DO) TaxID=589924 RepID=D3RX18_FERPA|nr:hypothetical protein [Ferroglobus placidus]ADC65031.1 hypothetical protein Ferp_0863 [Ferroglobus placidus DSM 10642]